MVGTAEQPALLRLRVSTVVGRRVTVLSGIQVAVSGLPMAGSGPEGSSAADNLWSSSVGT